MSDKLLSKYLNRPGENGRESAVTDAELDGGEDLGAFGLLRGAQRDRAISVELRRKSGEITAIGYAWIERITYVPSLIVLHASGQREIRIRGRNLNTEVRPQVTLFQSLVRQKACWIREAEQSAILQADRKTVVIEEIEW